MRLQVGYLPSRRRSSNFDSDSSSNKPTLKAQQNQQRARMECAGVGGQVGGELMNTSGANNWFRLSGGFEAWTRWEWAWLRL